MNLGWLNADIVQAFGVALATVIGAITARQAGQVRQLQARVTELEGQDLTDADRYRTLVRLVRQFQRQRDDLAVVVGRTDPTAKVPEAPEIPEWLAGEL
ncbi:hypothetical protein [Nocardia arizonensis]|uniref:hypothetical protein n=1 Tax=Nocardia arizonensis TaxID=1141647 RepID=UPI0006D10A08|nr:hypothetical protein [Nocardia arizonensis]